MLKHAILAFAAWFIRPLGYVVVSEEVIEDLNARVFRAEEDLRFYKRHHYHNVKVDFKA